MMFARWIILCAVFALAAVWTCGSVGCAARNPWTWNTPPTRVNPSPAMRADRRTVVVVGEFADPTAAPPHARGVGRFMSEAFSRALLNDGNYDVWINPGLSREAEQIAFAGGVRSEVRDQRPEVSGQAAGPSSNGPTSDFRPPTAGSPQRVNFVVVGKVTDFLYTGDLPPQVSRRSVAPPFGRRNEAIVAIDMKIVDMRTRRVVGADHIRATVPAAGSMSAKELHGALPFDSYLFWSTPLGRAGKQVIESAVSRIDAVVPPPFIDPQIEQMIAWRRVSIVGGSMAGVSEGQEFYVLLPSWSSSAPALNRGGEIVPGTFGAPGSLGSPGSPSTGDFRAGGWRPVHDAHTGHPLMVRIDTVNRTHSTGWLLGERPLEISLRGALLSTELPPSEHDVPPAEPEQGPLANMPAAVGKDR